MNYLNDNLDDSNSISSLNSDDSFNSNNIIFKYDTNVVFKDQNIEILSKHNNTFQLKSLDAYINNLGDLNEI